MAAASGIGWARLLPDSVEVRLILDRRSASRRCGCASGAAFGITERCRAVTVTGSCAGGAARTIAECLGAVAVSRDRASGPAAGIAERGLVLRRRGRDHGERERGEGDCLHRFILVAAVVQREHRMPRSSIHRNGPDAPAITKMPTRISAEMRHSEGKLVALNQKNRLFL